MAAPWLVREQHGAVHDDNVVNTCIRRAGQDEIVGVRGGAGAIAETGERQAQQGGPAKGELGGFSRIICTGALDQDIDTGPVGSETEG